MDDSIGSNTSSWDADTFEHWLEQMADSRGVSNEEVLTQLASSLWVLDELEALIDETDIHSELPIERNAHTEPNPSTTDQSALTDRLDTLEARLNDLEATHNELDSNVNNNVDNIEDVLRYLVDRTDTLSERLSTLTTRLESVEAQLQDWQTTQSKVADLKTEATRQGITTPECEQCGNTVQLATLARPECPTCSQPFDTVSPKGSWFGTPTIGGDTSSTATPPHPPAPDSDAAEVDSDQHSTTMDTSNLASMAGLGDENDTPSSSTESPEDASTHAASTSDSPDESMNQNRLITGLVTTS